MAKFWIALVVLVALAAVAGPVLERFRVKRKLLRLRSQRSWQLVDLKIYKNHYSATIAEGATTARHKFVLRHGQIEFI